ncbi:MAG: response regulator [Thermodesulfovibrionales bacterium]
MEKQLRILILEDVPADAELVENELRRAGIEFTSKVVKKREDFLKELNDFEPHIILSDYNVPSFDGPHALEIVKEKCPEIPFIFVSGAIGEELAIETLKMGATDYVLKDKLQRLVPSVNRALREVEERSARRQAEEELKKRFKELEEFYEIAVNRELKMVELKEEIERLKEELRRHKKT